MSLIRQFKLLVLLPAFCLTMGMAQAKSFSENGLLARLHALAARARLNLIVNSPDRNLGDFRSSKSQSSIETLQKIADAADCTTEHIGTTWLITARERKTPHKTSNQEFFYPSACPIESLMARKNNSHTADTRTFTVPSINACIISGERRRTETAAEHLRSLEKPAVPAELHLGITAGNSPQTASLSLQLLTNTSFCLDLAAPGSEPLVATFSFSCDASDSFSLALENADANASDAGSLNSQLQHGAQTQKSLVIKSDDSTVNINWNASLTRPFPEKPDKKNKNSLTGRARLNAARPQPESTAQMNLALLYEPIAKILGRVAASESVNLAVDKELSGNLSIFFFGPDLYFEEQFNLIARCCGGSVRKIGNTWLVAPTDKFVDAFDFGYNITKRLQYSDSEAVAATLKACLANIKAPASCRVAADKAINAIIIAGSADIIDSLGKLLFELDRPPVLFDSRLSLRSDSGDFSETFGINTGLVSSRQIELRDVTAEIELLPVSLPHLTGPGIKTQTSLKLKSGLELKLVFWSELPESDFRPLLSFKSTSSASLFMSGSRSDLQFEDHRYLPHESEDCNNNETDDAFESAF